MGAASAAGFALMVAALVGQLYAGRLFSPAPLVIAAQAGAFLLMLWARRTFGLRSFHATAGPTAGGLVTAGPYRYVRHPIYAAVFYFSLAGALGHLGAPASLLFPALILTGAWIRIHAEEHLLVARYPEYRAYAAKTARLVPGLF